ncbi:hypothetical protein EUGRSUZ_L00490 [Eucalyptus grandis]|uniref:Uncharacterized protein n=2 Tax=Eucalyptus grandis TaxID=71139 RepID=A0ACC3KX93_EUCGR|nr:hypothetical protein EUGRSUZ_L00490 [Eucalyptus grandis]
MEMGKSLEAETSGESSAIDYDVFLSFRGPDTRQTFTDCLYHEMLEANIRVFFDKEDIHVGKEIGDELSTAIEKSKIYIPIFSRGYASSPWCLRELARMVECKKYKPSEKEILPIFYDVEPHDVKLKSQLYVGPLEEHEERFGPEMRRKWEDALTSVAQIKGWELKRQGYRKETIEAVCLDGNAQEIYKSEEFSRVPNIRFLKLRGGYFVGDFKKQLSRLRYLSWNRCPHELLAINFHPRNLVVLNLSFSAITEDWAGWSQIKVAKKLKVLDLTNCNNMTRTPNFSGYLSLERLILKNCRRLIDVDGSLEKLKCLIFFNVDGCTNLTELSEGIGQLEKLEYLYLGNCRKLRKLPESFARVASLVELDLSYTAITRLPVSIGNQKRLSILKLQSTQIDELPSSIGNLRELKSLFLSGTKIKALPISIGNLESLLELDVSGTRCLRLPESIGGLSRLKVINISNSCIRELPRSIVMLKDLEELHGRDCSSLKWEIPEGISELLLLRVLDLQATRIRNVPATIQLLPQLEKLNLWQCKKLEVLPTLPTSLISLSFGSSLLQYVPDLSNLTELAELSYGGHDESCHPFFFQDGPCRQSLVFLPPSLSILSLEYHKLITSLSFHCDLRNLTRLRIYQCCWKEVQLDGLEQLIEFEVEGLKLLERFSGLSRLKRLKLWKLIGCPNLTAIQGLGSMESLEQLEIKECPKIESLDDLLNLKKLEYLAIRGCEVLPVVKGLDELETLKRLDFNRCRSLESFTNVFNSKIRDRCRITIFNCSKLVDPSYGGLVSSYKQWKAQEVSNRVRNQSSQN